MEEPWLPHQEWGCEELRGPAPQEQPQLVSYKTTARSPEGPRGTARDSWTGWARTCPFPPCSGEGSCTPGGCGQNTGPCPPAPRRRPRHRVGGSPPHPASSRRPLHAVPLLDESTVPSPSFEALRAVEVSEVTGEPPCWDRSKSLNRSAGSRERRELL